MGEKSWQYEFNKHLDRIRIHFVTDGKWVTNIIVVQYEAYIDGQWHAIVRFDEAHGFFHRDVMSPITKQEKMLLSSSDKNAALSEAIAEIKEQWAAYRKHYEEQYYDQKSSNRAD